MDITKTPIEQMNYEMAKATRDKAEKKVRALVNQDRKVQELMAYAQMESQDGNLETFRKLMEEIYEARQEAMDTLYENENPDFHIYYQARGRCFFLHQQEELAEKANQEAAQSETSLGHAIREAQQAS